MRVCRPTSDQLVLTRPRFAALVRLLIWCVIVAGFFWVLVVDQPPTVAQGGHSRWLAALVPVILLPYLFDIVGVLLRGESHVFDGAARELRAAHHSPVPFAQIQCLELHAVNGGCEELALRARLHDGRCITLMTDDASSRVVNIASEAADLVGVELTRR